MCKSHIVFVAYNHIAQVRSKDSLMQAGIDSLTALEMRNNIQTRFDIEIPATIIHDYPSVQALADYIEDLLLVTQPTTSYNAFPEPSTKHVRMTCKQNSRINVSSHCQTCYLLLRIHATEWHLGLQRLERGSSDVKRKLREIANVILGMDVPPQQPLMEAGLDSLAATEMHNAISTSFREHELPATFVFDYPTIDAMVQYLTSKDEVADTFVVPIAVGKAQGHESRSSEIIGMSTRYPSNAYGTINFFNPRVDIPSDSQIIATIHRCTGCKIDFRLFNASHTIITSFIFPYMSNCHCAALHNLISSCVVMGLDWCLQKGSTLWTSK